MQKEIAILARTETLRQTLASRLREAGHTVSVSSSLEDALRIVREVPIGVALIETIALGEGSAARSQILALRPDCDVIFLDSFEQAKRTGNLLDYGLPDYILGGSELVRLITAAGRVDDSSYRLEEEDKRAQALTKALDVLVSLQEADDEHFAGFTHQVARLSGAIAEEMGFSGRAQEEIVIAALLRDIGKVGVKREILQERGRLPSEEFEQMKTHALWSVRLLEHIVFAGKVLPIIRHHHERYDGTGYPDCLKGRQIPLGARIIATAESFAAMIWDRPHRPARSYEKAIDELMTESGTQFDPEVVEALMKILQKSPTLSLAALNRLILVVEPEKEFRQLLRMRLLNEGYAVIATGELASEILSPVSRRPDLVLFDASNGGREAFQYLNRLRLDEAGQHTSFAVTIFNEDRDFKLLALRHGVDDIIMKSDDLEEIAARVANILTRVAARREGTGLSQPAGVRGHLRNLSLPDIIQMLCMGMKSACVTLASPGRSGRIWLHDGVIIHAECGTKTGEEAFYELMRWDEAEFLIQHGVAPNTRSIETDPMSLLMEFFRQADETTAAEARERATTGTGTP